MKLVLWIYGLSKLFFFFLPTKPRLMSDLEVFTLKLLRLLMIDDFVVAESRVDFLFHRGFRHKGGGRYTSKSPYKCVLEDSRRGSSTCRVEQDSLRVFCYAKMQSSHYVLHGCQQH